MFIIVSSGRYMLTVKFLQHFCMLENIHKTTRGNTFKRWDAYFEGICSLLVYL